MSLGKEGSVEDFFLGAVHGGVGENKGRMTPFLLNWSGSQFEFHKHASNSNWIQTLELGILILIKGFFLICGVLHIGFLWFLPRGIYFFEWLLPSGILAAKMGNFYKSYNKVPNQLR